MANEKLYIHETIQISVRHRKEYLDHFCSWGPISREYYNMHCLGVWATVGSTDAWPEAIVMWELDGLDALTRMLSGEFAFLKRDDVKGADHYSLFWEHAPDGVTDTAGYDRLLIPTPTSLTLAEAVEQRVGGIGYYHETARVQRTQASRYLELYEAERRPFLESLGMRFIGAYRTLLKNDSEALVLWALPEWDAWARMERESSTGPELKNWRARTALLELDYDAKLLTPAARNPLNTGQLL